MHALQLLNQGKLDEAIASATDMVRNAPGVTGAREILAELFCLRGDLERADKQAETILMQQPAAAVTSSLMRQLLRAETARRECWREGRVPEFLGEPDEACRQKLAALVALRHDDKQEAGRIIAELDEPSVSGHCNDRAFHDFRDLDDLCSNFMEVLTSTGKYYWIPFARIESMHFEPVTRPRDLLWRQCRMIVTDGPDGVVYVPALYVHTDAAAEGPHRLGHATDWLGDAEEPVLGVGQRVFLVDDEEMGIMEIKSLTFGSTSSETAEA